MSEEDEGWTVVDVNKKKREKQRQNQSKKKELRKQVNASNKAQREALMMSSYSGWTDEVPPSASKKSEDEEEDDEDGFQSELSNATMFSAFNDMEARKKAREQRLKEAQERAAGGADAKAPKKKKKKTKKPSVAQLSSQVETEKLSSFLAELTQRYPNHEDQRLKALAEYFDTMFAGTTLGTAKVMEEKTFARRLELPLSYLEPESITILARWLRTFQEKELINFVVLLLQEINKAEKRQKNSGVGLKMVLQIILRRLPAIPSALHASTPFLGSFCTETPLSYQEKDRKMREERREGTAHLKYIKFPNDQTKLLREAVVPLMVWAFGQTIEDSPAIALALWYQFLVPLLCVPISKATQSLIYDYINELLKRGNNLKKCNLNKTDEVHALEQLTLVRGFLTPEQYEQDPLSRVYSWIEKITLWKDKDSPHHFFPMLLKHAGHPSKIVREETLERLVKSLHIDPQCYDIWRKAYPHAIAQSSNLVLFITENLDRVTNKSEGEDEQTGELPPLRLDLQALHDLLVEFLDINEQIEAGTFSLKVRVKKGTRKTKLWAVDKRELEVCKITCTKLKQALPAVAKRLRVRLNKFGAGGKNRNADGSSGGGWFLFLMMLLATIALVALLAVYQHQQCIEAGLSSSGSEFQVWLCDVLVPFFSPLTSVSSVPSAPSASLHHRTSTIGSR